MDIIASLLLWNMPFPLNPNYQFNYKKKKVKIFQIGTYRHQELTYESQQWWQKD